MYRHVSYTERSVTQRGQLHRQVSYKDKSVIQTGQLYRKVSNICTYVDKLIHRGVCHYTLGGK